MLHVTRCPNCHTGFRVTDAHLSASEGKVRCGRCAFVFDARSHFVGEPTPLGGKAAEASAPVLLPTAAPPVEATAAPLAASAPEMPAPEDAVDSGSAALQVDASEFVPPPDKNTMLELDLDVEGAGADLEEPDEQAASEPDPVPAAPVDGFGPDPVFIEPAAYTDLNLGALPADALDNLSFASVEAAEDHSVAAQTSLGNINSPEPEPEPEAEPEQEPEPSADSAPTPTLDTAAPVDSVPFVAAADAAYRPILTAEDEALLRIPAAPSPWRWLWAIPCFLALLTLGAQLVYHYRTEVSVQLPGARPYLARFCAELGCKVELPARSELLRTEWSELTQAPEQENLIQLSATLRNQAAFEQALPMMELTLTDNQDRVLVKTMYTAAEYLAPGPDGHPVPPPTSLAAGGDLRVFLRLDTGELRSGGYQIYWFYPLAR